MKHPNESNLIDWFLEEDADPESEHHLETCDLCKDKLERLRITREHLLRHETPRCDSTAAEDVFATAWLGAGNARRERGSLIGWFRWGLQPAGLFMAGLFLGYLLFSNSESGPETLAPPAGEHEIGRKERTDPPADLEDLEGSMPAAPQTAQASETPLPASNEIEYWERAGFKNAKFTPTLRYEGGREVYGGLLEAETPGGALVVMNY